MLLLCSDGVHNVMGDGRLCELMSLDEAPDVIARLVVSSAIQRGSRDNPTAISCGISNVPRHNPGGARREHGIGCVRRTLVAGWIALLLAVVVSAQGVDADQPRLAEIARLSSALADADYAPEALRQQSLNWTASLLNLSVLASLHKLSTLPPTLPGLEG